MTFTELSKKRINLVLINSYKMKSLKTITGLLLVFLTLNTMANFQPAFEKTAQIEGGYVNLPSDRGGETIDGISRKFHPNARVWIFVDTVKQGISLEENETVHSRSYFNKIEHRLSKLPQFKTAVKEFYKSKFWDTLKLDLLSSQSIAEELYDTAVNQGPSTSVRYLQRSLNLLNRNQSSYRDLSVDGQLGPITLKTVEDYFSSYSRYGRDFAVQTLLKALNGEQYITYRQIAISSPSQEINFAGWLRRV